MLNDPSPLQLHRSFKNVGDSRTSLRIIVVHVTMPANCRGCKHGLHGHYAGNVGYLEKGIGFEKTIQCASLSRLSVLGKIYFFV